MDITLHFDGACEPVNPGGTASWGWTIDTGLMRFSDGGVIGSGAGMTNNVAEFHAVGHALRFLLDSTGARPLTSLVIRGDSQLVIRQLTGEWQCRAPNLVPLRDRCRDVLRQLGCEWRAEWVERSANQDADRLSVLAWEAATGKPFPHRARKK